MRKLTFTVYGDDERQRALKALLVKDGHDVVPDGEICILPLPSPSLPPQCPRHKILLGGKLKKEFTELCRGRGMAVRDYYLREEYAVANAAICAEGAVGLAMAQTGFTLDGADVLVTGFGRIGRLLCLKLRALGARVTAAARKPPDLAWIRAFGCIPADMRDLSEALRDKSIVFNTVPAVIADFSFLQPECLYMELASEPGGLDPKAAQKKGARYINARGLPARTAPVSAASALRDTVYNILHEENMI